MDIEGQLKVEFRAGEVPGQLLCLISFCTPDSRHLCMLVDQQVKVGTSFGISPITLEVVTSQTLVMPPPAV